MPLNLIYITNRPEVALIAEENGVQRIMVDMETLGKEERQKNMNSVKSHHTVEDVAAIRRVLTGSQLLVRINPWHEHTAEEIEAVIAAGADSIMLPMWKSYAEVDQFLTAVNKRVHTTLLLETKKAEACLDAVLEHPLLEGIHIGLNDLHLSYGLHFMFELYPEGVVERICCKCREKGVPYGIGGIARLGGGLVPSEHIIMEHYRLGSTAAILSRAFCNSDEVRDMDELKSLFARELKKVRAYEESLPSRTEAEYEENRKTANKLIRNAAEVIRQKRIAMETK